MFLKINGHKFYGETKNECFEAFIHQPFVDNKDMQVIEELYNRADSYINEFCATEEELENESWEDDIFGKYCTDEILFQCFEEMIKDNPVRYRSIRFEEDDE